MEQPVLFMDASGNLMMAQDSETCAVPVQPIQFFPLTHPGAHWGLFAREPDGTLGIEVTSIPSPAELDPVPRSLLNQVLDKTFQKIQVSRVYSIKTRHKGFRWTVESNHGRLTFDVENNQDINKIAQAFVLIKDIENRRFLIHLNEMDARSRALLDLVI